MLSAMGRMGTWSAVLACLGLLSVVSTPLGAQDPQTGSVAGVILSTVTGQPLADATVSLMGRDGEAVSDDDGVFLIEQVPIGPVRVRFEASGYTTVVEDLEASVGAFLQVRLSPVEAVLDELMVLVGAERSRDGSQQLTVEGNRDSSARSLLDLLAEQVPGVEVNRGGGNLGSGAFVHIRGATSLSGDLAPEIYLDGIRLDNRNTDERAAHVLDMISAEEVARIRVYKGAAGGAGLPLGGANGAIIIETNRGRSGR